MLDHHTARDGHFHVGGDDQKSGDLLLEDAYSARIEVEASSDLGSEDWIDSIQGLTRGVDLRNLFCMIGRFSNSWLLV
jgi:hypothetical protein